jgi:hypothetical protein
MEQRYTCPECEYFGLGRFWKFCPKCGEKINWEQAWYLKDTEGDEKWTYVP